MNIILPVFNRLKILKFQGPISPLATHLSVVLTGYQFGNIATSTFPSSGCTMSLIGGFLKAAASFCHSTLIQSPRSFSTGVCSRIRMHVIPQPRIIDRWTEKRVAFGVYDNIGILGDFKAHPRDLIVGPVWLRGFRGNEFQRLTRKKRMVGDRMMATDRHNLEKRIRFLYRRLNRYGKHR